MTGRIVADQSFFDQQLYGNGWQDTTANTWPSLAALSVDFNRGEEGAPYTTDPTGLRAGHDHPDRLSGDGIPVDGGKVNGAAPRLILTHDSPRCARSSAISTSSPTTS